MTNKSLKGKHKLTQAQKDANNKQWYKDQANLLDNMALGSTQLFSFGDVSEEKRMQVNYDLFNNILNTKELEYVCKPFGDGVGELPANFTNRDIVSGKIKVLLGMEMKMPFSWKVVAVNEEATTRKEEEEFNRIRDYVVEEIMKPIKMQEQQQMMAQMKGRELNEEEKQQLQQQIEEEIQAKTPDKVRVYMAREHQDPAEALARQLLEYLILEKKAAYKFNKGWKHSTLSGKEIYWVGILNGEPDFEVVNPIRFKHDQTEDLDFIEDGDWAVREMRLTPSQVISKFGSELSERDIEKIYDFMDNPTSVPDSEFTFSDTGEDPFTIRVIHCNWKSLRLVQFLTYLDENGKEQKMVVDENYKLNPKQGDIRLEREWIPEEHEVYKIMSDIYAYARPVPGQVVDLDNLYNCKLSYFGACCDSLNSPTTSPMDRMKMYQYLFNIIIYRIELLMASDKGKILAGNINSVPKSAGVDINKFLYFMEANKIAWGNPNEEGNRGGNGDIGSLFKVLDMSLISDIQKYMGIADYIERKCGGAIGVTPQMEAQIAAGDAVTNVRQNLVQSSYIIQPYFELHNTVKSNVLSALLDKATVAYSQKQPRKLSYVLDDMTTKMLTVDTGLLPFSKYGLYVANSAKAEDAKKAVENLSQAALQNQQADLSDIIKVIKSNSVNEAEELLDAAQERKAVQLQQIEKNKMEAEKQAKVVAAQEKKEDRAHEERMIILKEEERRKTILQSQAMESMGFDPNKDEDGDGTPDVMEVYKFGLDAEIKRGKQTLDSEKLNLEKNKFDHQTKVDTEKLKQEEEKMRIMKQKNASAKK